jgi:tetratricopeptide (TPR) repeat protein
MMALAGFGPDPDNLRSAWLQRIRRNLEQAEPAARASGLRHLKFLLGENPDVESQLTIIDLKNKDRQAQADADDPNDADDPEDIDPFADEGGGIIRNEPFDRETAQSMLYLASGSRGQQAGEIALRLLAQNQGRASTRADLHAYAASCFRRAGQEAKAAEHDAWVEKLALGDAALDLRIAGGYAFGDDYQRAALWHRRAAFEVAPDPLPLADVFSVFATDELTAGHWPQAAAASEIACQIYAGVEFGGTSLLPMLLRFRQQADLARALALLPAERERAVAMLDHCHAISPCDGSLADYFFPAVRAAGLVREHDAWFDLSWNRLQTVIKRFPRGYNTLNTTAWMASRAARQLDAAEAGLKEALAIYPRQAAFLDTMAEIQFARGRRDEAIKWSLQSVNAMPNDSAIRRQYHRFRLAPLPQ